MVDEREAGQILTFYSFKGGVGRTMALANVAFLAAQNGLRVLMMDWDLEAPGLAYYFRGLLEPSAARQLKHTPGVLDVLWEWTSNLQGAYEEESFQEWLEDFEEGRPFARCVRSIVGEKFLPDGGALDFIGAGSQSINTPESGTYEDALARFSWPSFFEECSGGIVIEGLRKWAKSNYDLVLLDSRTGLADVAGLCTMQIPDVVALCFILNRQNIDGVAKVAGAIREHRSEQVKVRAVPMRVARRETPEESDARARAISELTRVGGFPNDGVQHDLRLLGVAIAENVPFYETLAPLVATSPIHDPLTLNYLQLASELLGRPLSMPELDTELVDMALARLQPRHATVEYVTKLKTAEPMRAIAELQKLIIGVQETQFDGNLPDEEYVLVLVEVAFSIDASVSFSECIGLQAQVLDLLRELSTIMPDKWNIVLIDCLERHLSLFGPALDEEAELAIIEELDSLLAEIPTTAAKLKRVVFKRRAAWSFYFNLDQDATNQTLGEINSLTKELRRESKELTPDQFDSLLASELDALLLRGDVLQQRNQLSQALEQYERALRGAADIVFDGANAELRRLRSDIHVRMATSLGANDDIGNAAKHSVEAARWAKGGVTFYTRFSEMANIVSDAKNADLVHEFCALAFGSVSRPIVPFLGNFFGRSSRSATSFLDAVSRLLVGLGFVSRDEVHELIPALLQTVELVLKTLLRRRPTFGDRQIEDVRKAIDSFRLALNNSNISWEPSPEVADGLSVLNAPRVRKTSAHAKSKE